MIAAGKRLYGENPIAPAGHDCHRFVVLSAAAGRGARGGSFQIDCSIEKYAR